MRPTRTSCILATLLCLLSSTTQAATLIRDAEIEHTLRRFGDPLFQAAGLKPSNVKLFIVQDDSLNAFVAGGMNMFIHTGLIEATTTPDMLIGVMAHETGHIAGGHLAKGGEKLKDAMLGSIFTYVLGAAAAVASKNPGAAAAVITGGQNTVARNFLSYTRANENAADQAALGFLDKLNMSAEGMLKMFQTLQRSARQHIGATDPYLMTHPLNADRINLVRNHVDRSDIPQGQYPKSLDMLHQRMLAKLYGFIESPEKTLLKYPVTNRSVPARLARAVAYYKMPDIERSMKEMDSLLAEAPKDPFFHELKGQILYENRMSREALAQYQTANNLLPNNPLIMTDLAKIELDLGDNKSAIAHLEKATSLDNSNPSTWYFLALAYGKAGNIGMSSLALAEQFMLLGDDSNATRHALEATKQLPAGSPSHRRAEDLKNSAQNIRDQKE